MNLFQPAIIYGLICFIALGACVTERVVPTLDITVTPIKFDQKSPAKKQLEKLRSLIANDSEWLEAGVDLTPVLEAQQASELGKLSLASEKWLGVALQQEGALAQYALGQWQEIMNKILGSKSDPVTIGKFFWAEAQGRDSWIAKERDFEDEESVIKYFNQSATQSEIDDELILDSENKDLLLTDRARLYCKNSNDKVWKDFLGSLRGSEKAYWKALVKVCRNEREGALKIFSSIALNLWKEKSSRPLSISSYRNIINIYRYLGDRKAASNGFTILVKKMNDPSVDFKKMGFEDSISWEIEKINTTLWAARYRSMVGDYLLAKVFVEDGLQALDRDWTKLGADSDNLEDVTELKAEAYHILANRIYLEKFNFSEAYASNKLGLEIDNISDKWNERFLWFEGWYLYLDKKNQQARDTWNKLLEILAGEDDSRAKEKTLFWLAKIASDSKDESSFRAYLKQLAEEFPLGFYNLYAVQQLGWKTNAWISKNAADLQKDLSTWDVDIGKLQNNKALNLLRHRAELSLLIGSESLAKVTALELHRKVRKLIKIGQTETHLYVSRILFLNSLFLEAIGITSNVYSENSDLWTDHPEQILVYYPTPFKADFKEASDRYALDQDLLFSIARQESGFRPSATSWAGAKGLLQLMPKTASRYAPGNLKEAELVTRLEDPNFNIDVAGRYLRHLKGYYKGNWSAIIASYNAGEFVVDRWAKVRNFGDELTWIENIPFGETKNYVKKVSRNWAVYRELRKVK